MREQTRVLADIAGSCQGGLKGDAEWELWFCASESQTAAWLTISGLNIYTPRPTKILGDGSLTLERRRAKCVFCPNSLDVNALDHDLSCRPIRPLNDVVYTGAYPSNIGPLPALSIPRNMTSNILKDLDYPRPVDQRVVLPVPEVAAVVGDKWTRSRKRRGV